MTPYSPRPIWFAGVDALSGWWIKRYRIRHNDADFDETRFSASRPFIAGELPAPATTGSRSGVGFLIEHQGRGADYVVLGWWDRENELPLRVWLRTDKVGAEWRPATGAESVCVWDLQVIWHEREAYVTTVLSETADETAIAEHLRRTDGPWTAHPAKNQSTNS